MAKNKKEDKPVNKFKPNTRYVIDFKQILDLKDILNILEGMDLGTWSNDKGELAPKAAQLGNLWIEDKDYK